MSESDDKARIAELESQIAELKAAMIILQRRVDPPPRPVEPARMEGHSPDTYRYLDQLSLPKSVFDDYVANVDPEVIKQLRTDGKR